MIKIKFSSYNLNASNIIFSFSFEFTHEIILNQLHTKETGDMVFQLCFNFIHV